MRRLVLVLRLQFDSERYRYKSTLRWRHKLLFIEINFKQTQILWRHFKIHPCLPLTSSRGESLNIRHVFPPSSLVQDFFESKLLSNFSELRNHRPSKIGWAVTCYYCCLYKKRKKKTQSSHKQVSQLQPSLSVSHWAPRYKASRQPLVLTEPPSFPSTHA